MSLYKFRYYNSNFEEWDEFYTSWKPKLVNAKCPHCASHPLMIRNFYQVLSGHCQRYQCPACEEVIDIKETLFASHDDLNVVLADDEITPPTSTEISKDAIFVDLDIIEKLLAIIDYIDYEKIKRVFIVLVQNIFNNKDFSIEEEVKNRLLKIQPKLYKYLESLEDSNKKIGYFDALFDLIVEGLA